MGIDVGLALGAISTVAIPVGFGIGVIAMANPSRAEFRFAKICFIVAAIAAVASFAWLTYEYPLGPGKILVAAVVGATAVVGLVAALEWVSKKEHASLPTPPPQPPKYTGEIKPSEKVIFSTDGALPRIQIGTSGTYFTGAAGEFATYLLPVLRRDQFKIETVDGLIKVSTKVADATGNLTAEINRNEWSVLPPPGTWDRNYNSNSLEVKDPKGRIVLQVSIVADAVQIQGAWPLGPEWKAAGAEYVVVRADPSGKGAQFVLYPYNPKPGVEWPEIKPIFEYPSERHLGELAKQ